MGGFNEILNAMHAHLRQGLGEAAAVYTFRAPPDVRLPCVIVGLTPADQANYMGTRSSDVAGTLVVAHFAASDSGPAVLRTIEESTHSLLDRLVFEAAGWYRPQLACMQRGNVTQEEETVLACIDTYTLRASGA